MVLGSISLVRIVIYSNVLYVEFRELTNVGLDQFDLKI